MSLPPLFDRLRLPAIGAPLFIVSNPDLVIAQCKAGIVGSFPALNARPQSLLDEWLHRITEELAAWDRDHPETPVGALCGQPDRPPLQRPADGGHGDLPEMEGADRHHLAGRAGRGQPGRPWLGRDHPARHHQRPLRPQGGRERRRRHHRGRGRRRRPCRAALALRPDPGDPRLVRRAADPVGRDRHRPRHPRRAGDGRRPRLYRLALHRHRRGQCRPRPTSRAFARAAPTTSSIRACSPACTAITCRKSIELAGLDPANLPEGDIKTMDFGTGDGSKAKAWRDIWGSGQGIGAIDCVLPAGDYVARLIEEYRGERVPA